MTKSNVLLEERFAREGGRIVEEKQPIALRFVIRWLTDEMGFEVSERVIDVVKTLIRLGSRHLRLGVGWVEFEGARVMLDRFAASVLKLENGTQRGPPLRERGLELDCFSKARGGLVKLIGRHEERAEI